MSKINQIQNAIRGLEGGAFQKLGDDYLSRIYKDRNYQLIESIGSVIGSNKTKTGTPDSLFQAPNGKYVFVEYSTEISGLLKKFEGDIDNCLNESKTNISIEKIEFIILFYSHRLEISEIETLRAKCSAKNIELELYGIHRISHDILQKFPIIAKEHLGVALDTGQILSIDDFLKQYEKNQLSTPLSNSFYFREKEKAELLKSIEDNNITIISGHAGVGKSKLAIECYQTFLSENPSYQAYCIHNKSLDLFEDIKAYFSNSGQYLIFVDDANRVDGFQHNILTLLYEKPDNQNFKIIVTVRDYALSQIRESCRPYKNVNEINLNALDDNEIEEIIRDIFEIRHSFYLRKINNIAQGNPRLAFMAAKTVKDNNSFESINSVSQLYDEYFASIRNEIVNLKDENILKVAGIVAFFRTVSINDIYSFYITYAIEKVFNIPMDNFWGIVKQFHDIELFDVYENHEAVKISNQTLATYLFYLSVFKENKLDFSTFLHELMDNIFNGSKIPQFKEWLKEAVYPIIDIMGYEEAQRLMLPDIENAWDYFENKSESYAFYEFMDVFWFFKQTDCLVYIQEEIEKLPQQKMSIQYINFDIQPNFGTLPTFIPILTYFSLEGDEVNISLSLEFIFQYMEKQPQDISVILGAIIEEYSIRRESYQAAYLVQNILIQTLLEKCDSGKNEFFSRCFIAIAEKYLKTKFNSRRRKRGTAIIEVSYWCILETPELIKLRETIWKSLFDFYKNTRLRPAIYKLLFNYMRSTYQVSKDIISSEIAVIFNFFKQHFEHENVLHCVIVHHYFRFLTSLKIPYEENIESLFKPTNYLIYDTLFNYRLPETSTSSYKEQLILKIREFVRPFSLEDYKHLFTNFWLAKQNIENFHSHQINYIFEELFERDKTLFTELVTTYLHDGDCFDLHPAGLISHLIELHDISKTLEIILTPNYPTKIKWLFEYHAQLPAEKITDFQLRTLEQLYQIISETNYMFDNFKFIEQYEKVEEGFTAKIIQIIINRAEQEPIVARILYSVLNSSECGSQRELLFSKYFSVFEEAYIAADKARLRFIEHLSTKERIPNNDYDGSIFSKMLKKNSHFMDKYLKAVLSSNEGFTKDNHHREYSFIWKCHDYMGIMKKVIDRAFKLREDKKLLTEFDYFYIYFENPIKSETNGEIIKAQDKLFVNIIEQEITDKNYVNFLFETAIVKIDDLERKASFYRKFIELNSDINDFKNLSLYTSPWMLVSSQISILENRLNFYQLLLQELKTIRLLKHRQFIDQEIKKLHQEIQNEKVQDFVDIF